MNTPLPRPLAVLLLPLILSGAPHRSQEPAPAAATAPPWPAARMAHDLVFHDELGQVLLLGGTPADPQGGLWAWSGAQWTPLAAGGPTDRYHFACAYDRHRELLFVHGGARGGPGEVELFADTWTFDGTQWQQVATDGPARDHHALAYLGARRQLVLFGGGHGEEAEFHGDTWLWTEDHWERATAEGPPARASHRLSEDSQRGRLVLYGGFGNGDTLLGDTWEWDGATWHPRAAGGPGTLAFPRTAFDADRQVTLLFGGSSPPFEHRDATWTFDGERWRQHAVAAPPARSMHAVAHDPIRGRLVLFGGLGRAGPLDDLWEWDGEHWSAVRRP